VNYEDFGKNKLDTLSDKSIDWLRKLNSDLFKVYRNSRNIPDLSHIGTGPKNKDMIVL